ncbi:MAG: HAD-IIB family hydrolase [Pleurocapsa sp. SU_196_0]|nr:HAD-IIB family hydrolase [Pleurocapsa sp. SU_196_0]
MIRLLLTDVDGTLIGTGSVIHPRVLEAISKANASELHLAICTGRPSFSRASQYATLVSPNEPHIFQNGAHVATLFGRTIQSSVLNVAAYRALVAVSRRVGVTLEVYTETRCLVEQHSAIAEAHQELIGMRAQHTDLFSVTEPVLRVQWVNTRREQPRLEAEMQRISQIQYSSAGTPDMPEALFTSVTQTGTSKLEGAAALARFYGVALSEVMMVGDGDNDIEVLQGVGLGVAMGNASAGAVAAAQHRVRHVDEGGLADAIELALETRAVNA